MTHNNEKFAGLLLFVSGFVGFFTIIITETQYRNYSTSANYISDLGIGPSALVFNIGIFLTGMLSVTGSYFIWKTFKSILFAVMIGLGGVGTAGVGLFPENLFVPHSISALLAFAFSGLSAITSYKFTKAPFSYISVLLGTIAISALVLMASGFHLGLGIGGIERMIAYPNLFWTASFGSYLMADSKLINKKINL